MGFIKAGKSLKRLRHSKSSDSINSSHNPKRRNPDSFSSSTILNDDASYDSPEALDNQSLSILERFPFHIIYQIFIYSRPHNNLPLVNKAFHKLLKFDPRENDSYDQQSNSFIPLQLTSWHNASLAIDMVRTWYTIDLNCLLNFDRLEEIINFYQIRLEDCRDSWNMRYPEIRMENDPMFRNAQGSITDAINTINDFRFHHKIALSDDVFSNKFVTARFIHEYFKLNVIANDYSQPDIPCLALSQEESENECKWRARFLREKFLEVSFLISKFQEAMVDGTVMDYYSREGEHGERKPFPCYFTTRTNVATDESDFSLLEGLERVSEKLINGPVRICIDSNNNRIKFDNTIYRTRDFPFDMYNHGINSSRKFSLMRTMNQIYGIQFFDAESILVKTFDNYFPRNIGSISTTELSLDDITKFVLWDPCLITERTVIEAFELFDIYEKKDCSEFGVNYKKDSLTDDISKAILRLLESFYHTDIFENDKALWRYVVDAKSFSLVQVLMKFNDTPHYEVLHNNMI
ncbi:uncharacterized protein RJT20DRAFT_128033 [Scheffersomyces xylosifermentans]|uniref:uncharacterized protein n=1 Tax=Scheffersomyces xylosifermentans TaxID=1304137 RepID=UPI00315D6D71